MEVVLPPDVQALYPTADVHDGKALELASIPYTPRYFAALGTTLVRRLLARRAAPLKAVAVDADDTLWSGVVGEVGPAGVVVDEGRAELQRVLVGQARAGRLLFLCSKNEEADVRAALADIVGAQAEQ